MNELNPQESGSSVLNDEVNAKKFWERMGPGQKFIDSLRYSMELAVNNAAKLGSLSMRVNKDVVSERDREHMSAYSQLARELGYGVGPIELKQEPEKSNLVMKVSKKEPQIQE
jgi:hypothetical protein